MPARRPTGPVTRISFYGSRQDQGLRHPATRERGADVPYAEIEYEVADRIATITLRRPERLNAFPLVMRGELIDAFDRADADDEVRAVVVTGAGPAFCAGADLGAGPATFD